MNKLETGRCKACGRDAVELCPMCGTCIEYGYGLMGGGIGTYRWCCGESCSYFEKQQDEDAGKAGKTS